MNEYINREIAIERIKYKKPKVLYSEYGVGYERGLEDAIGLLNAIPAADIQPVKHGKMNEQKLNEITTYLKENVFKNPDIMYTEDDTILDLLEMIASLHNLLYEEVTGKRYDYMFHWANKIGSWVYDDFFDDEIGAKEHD